MEATVEERIQYTFGGAGLLRAALTHPSYKNQYPDSRDYQRLKFVGSAVIGMISANLVYTVLADKPAGELTVARARLANNAALCRVGHALKLGRAIRFGDSVGTSKCSSGTTDATVAIIGAVFVDGGYEAAKRVFDAHYAPVLLKKPKRRHLTYDNPKSELQTRIQKKHKAHPTYTTERQKGGADHNPKFESKVQFADVILGAGKGKNKREAETAAAADALKKMDRITAPEPTVPAEYVDVNPTSLISGW